MVLRKLLFVKEPTLKSFRSLAKAFHLMKGFLGATKALFGATDLKLRASHSFMGLQNGG